MSEWLIFQTPIALVLFLAAYGASLFERFTKKTNGVLTLVSVVLAIAATAVLLLSGGSLWESAALFLLLFLTQAGVRV